jgi:hypothetical protein
MRNPDLAEMHSVSTAPPKTKAADQLTVDADGNVQLTMRDEGGHITDWRKWAPSTDAAGAVHTMIEWLARGAPGAFADFTI